MMRTILSFMMASFLLVGCPKDGKKIKYSVEDLQKPGPNFQNGLFTVQHPDKKSGIVNYQEAYNSFAAAENLGGGAKASFNAGLAAEKLGQLPKAEGHYKKAYDADPAFEAAMFSLARVLNEQGKGNEAVQFYKLEAEKNPKNFEARNDLIGAYIRAGQYDLALAEAQDILRYDPKNAGVYRNLSAMYYAQKNFSMSQLTANKSLELNDGDPGVYNNMGVTHLIQGDEALAIEKFKTAVQVAPTNYEANMNLGYVALNSGDYTLAHNSFTNALQSQEGSLDAKMGLAIATRGLMDYKKAAALYDDIIDADPTYERAYFNAAILHEKYTKDFAKSLKYLTAYISSKNGTLSPSHEVFALQERVKVAKAKEDEQKRIEAERKKEEEERRKRNEELLNTMATVVTDTRAKIASNKACIDEMLAEEVDMVLEQVDMVVEAKDTDMAADIQTLMDGYIGQIDDSIANCAPPAPEEAPSEEAPAEEGGGEEAAPE